MTVREFIEGLLDIVADGPHGDQTEIVATDSESGEIYTPVIAAGPDKDGVWRVHI